MWYFHHPMNTCASMLQIGLSGKAFENRYCEKWGSERSVARREVGSKAAPVTALTDLAGSRGAWMAQQTWPWWSGLCSPISMNGWLWVFEGGEGAEHNTLQVHHNPLCTRKISELSQLLQEKYQQISKHGLDDAGDVTSSSWEKKQQENANLLAFPYITWAETHWVCICEFKVNEIFFFIVAIVCIDSQIFFWKKKNLELWSLTYWGDFCFFFLKREVETRKCDIREYNTFPHFSLPIHTRLTFSFHGCWGSS